MRKSIYTLALFLSLLWSNAILAQEPCGTDDIHKKLMELPEYKARVAAGEQKLQNYIRSKGGKKRSSSSVIDTIPVVVHVLHTGQAVGTTYNISDAQIQSSIDRANAVFADYDGSGTDTNIRFALATRDPDGCTNGTGINRINATGTQSYETIGMASDATRLDLFNLSRWNTEEYLNFWIVSEIDDNDGGIGTQGFATYYNVSHQYDGVVCMYNTTGYDPTGSLGYELKSTANQNETIIHEFAHYLDVRHTFEGDDTACPTNTDCATEGDLCCDTDPHERTYSNVCWTGINNSCTGNNYGEVVQNYMAYSSQDCKDRFTADQVARMQAVIGTGRAGLMTSPGLTAVTVSEPTGVCAATTSGTGTSGDYGIGIIKITIGTWTTESGNSYEEGGYVDNWCNHIELESNTTYNWEITTAGNYDEWVRAWIDYNNDGTFTNASELIINPADKGFSFSGTFTTPASMTYNTALRLRIRGAYASNSTDACYDPTYGQAEDYSVYFANNPEITASETSLDGIHGLDNGSAPKTFTLSGNELTADVSISSAGTDFEISKDGTAYSNSLNLSQSSGTLVGQPVTIYAKLKAGLGENDYNDILTISSTDATDVSVNLSGEIDAVDAVRGNGIDLDGLSDYVSTAIQLPDTYTKEAWVKRESTGNGVSYNIISSGDVSSHVLYAPNGQGNKLSGGHNGSWAQVQDSEAIPVDEWTHVALTYDAGTEVMKLYKNGLLVDQATGITQHSNATFYIGNHISNNNCWEGQMDEVRIWNVVRTQEELRTNMHLTLTGTETGLEAYFQANESSGTEVDNKAGTQEGTLVGDAAFATSTVDVGAGSCSTVTLGGTGDATIEVNSNNLQIDFADGSTAPNGDLMIFKLTGSPANSPGDAYEGSEHWVVRNFGTNTTGLNIETIKMTLPVADDVLDYHTNTMSFYKRSSGSDGSWTTMASAANSVDYGDGEITFSGLSGFTTFSQLAVGSNGISLPITLTSFTANRKNEKEVLLQWATSYEENCQSYVVEKSWDGKRFEPVAAMDCKNQGTKEVSYKYLVQERQSAYYRLRQFDLDMSYTYTDVRFVGGRESLNTFSIYPNPSQGKVTVSATEVDANEVIEINLIDMQGRVLFQQSGSMITVNEALNQLLDATNNGVYFLNIQHAGETQNTRLLLNKK